LISATFFQDNFESWRRLHCRKNLGVYENDEIVYSYDGNHICGVICAVSKEIAKRVKYKDVHLKMYKY